MKTNPRTANAWAMYDWANSAFATTILAAVLPVYYQTVAGANLSGNQATVYWGYTTSIALAIAAVFSPILGAMADFQGAKKRYLSYFAITGMFGTALLYFVGTGEWLKTSIFFVIGNVGFAGANVFYDALLPHIADPDEIDQVSAKGFALGYLGGGILLAINLAMILLAPEDSQERMTRLAFLSVAVWWLVFSIPLWRYVPEPGVPSPSLGDENPFVTSFRRLAQTFRDVLRYRELLKFIVAFWFYSDGIGTIIKMGVIYGAEIGIGQGHLIGTLLVVQFVGVPFSFGFGWLGKRIGAKRAIYAGLVIYMVLTVGAYFMQTALHFWLLGLGIAVVQGGVQSLTRSMGARMIPKDRSGEFFGFFSVSIKFAGILGPLLFAFIAQIIGNSRGSILSIVVFFLVGLLLLTRVDVEEGMRAAEAKESVFRLTTTW